MKNIAVVMVLIIILLCSCDTSHITSDENELSGYVSSEIIIEETYSSQSDEETYSDIEITSANFCMAYMNHLKNPYSFEIKSIWAYDSVTGGSHVYVKFVAQNSFGVETISEITNTIPITKSVIESIADTDSVISSISIYIKAGQNERNDGLKGEWLDAEKIMTYINANYK